MAGPTTPQRCILVVDDDQDIVMVMETLFRDTGYIVDVAYDGLDALSRIRSQNYDVVVCDMVMPRMSGEHLFREVEKATPWMTSRFLFVTGMARSQDYDSFFSRTSTRYIEKPFHAEDLLALVNEIIAENKD
jgi:CheY-like chemotaxis protein